MRAEGPPTDLTFDSPRDNAADKRFLPWLVAVALFMESLDTTILNTGVPTIAKALHVAPLSMKAALTSYTLALAVFIPVSGWFADRYGTRRVFFSALGIFSLGSLLCGLSTSMPMLVGSRIVQGAGGALMLPVGRIAMVRTFPKSELLRATTFVAIPGLIGPLLGPLVGGLIVSYSHWRMIFFVNLPMGALGIWLAFKRMPDYRSPTRTPLDIVGLVLFGSGIALISYVLEVFGEHALSLRAEVTLAALAILLLLAYSIHSPRQDFPLLRIRLFKIRTFRAAVGGSFITRLGIGGMPFMLPLLYQIGLGFTPVQAGLLIMPQPLAAIILRAFTPRILARFGYRTVLLANTIGIGALIISFMTVSPGTSVYQIIAQAACLGFMSSLQYTSMGTLTFADLTAAQTSMGSSIASTVQQMSMSFGVAIASLLAALYIGALHAPGPEFIRGIHLTFLTMGILTILSSAVFLQLTPRDGAEMSRHDEPAEE